MITPFILEIICILYHNKRIRLYLFYFHGSVFYIGFYFYCFGLGFDYMVWDYYCTIPLPLNPLCPTPIGDFSLFMRGEVSAVCIRADRAYLTPDQNILPFPNVWTKPPGKLQTLCSQQGSKACTPYSPAFTFFFYEPCKVLSSFSLFNGL